MIFSFISNWCSKRKGQQSVLLPPPPIQPPQTVEWLLAHRESMGDSPNPVYYRTSNMDTPLNCLYRMYTFIVLDNDIELRNEVEYFFNKPKWAVNEIPDPDDSDPARYVILSGIPPLLIVAFNRLISRGLPRDAPAIIIDIKKEEAKPRILEEVPGWCANVPGLPQRLLLPRENGSVPPSEDHEGVWVDLLQKNILAYQPFVLFV